MSDPTPALDPLTEFCMGAFADQNRVDPWRRLEEHRSQWSDQGRGRQGTHRLRRGGRR